MFRKVLLSVIAVVVIAIPAVVGAHYYSSGYYRTVYQDREVTEYVPERKYVCDDYDRYHHDDYRYSYGYNEVRFYDYHRDYRRCYYTTSYEKKTRTVKVPVRQYVNTSSSYDYNYDRPYYNYSNYNRPYYYSSSNSYRPTSYYGYYYGI